MNDNLLAQIQAASVSVYEEVTVGPVTLGLRPVTLMEGLALLKRFPFLEGAIVGGQVSEENLLSTMLRHGPEAVCALIAISAGRKGDAEIEAALAQLPDDILVPLVGEVRERTAPDGVEAFFGRLVNLHVAAGGKRAEPEAKGKRVRRAA